MELVAFSGETEIVDLLIKDEADLDIQDEVSKKKSWDVNSICQLASALHKVFVVVFNVAS